MYRCTAPSRLTRHPLLLLVFLFVVSRLFLLYASMPALSDGEESAVGTIAMEFLRGPLLFPVTVKSSFFGIGETWQALVFDVPLYALFGPRFYLLKVAPLFLSTIALVAIWTALKRCHGQAAALIGALLWTFPPSIILRHQLLAWARHGDSILFVFLCFLMLLGIFPEEAGNRGPRRRWHILLLGVFCGWAFGYYGQFIVCATAAGVIILLLDPRRIVFFFLGFLLGNAPFIYILCRSTRLGIQIVSKFISKSLYGRIADIACLNVPELLSVRGEGVPAPVGAITGYVYAGLFYLCLAMALYSWGRLRRPLAENWRDIFFPVYTVVFVAFYLGSGFNVGGFEKGADIYNYKYLVLIFPAVLWIVSSCLARAVKNPHATMRAVGAVLAAFVTLSGAAGFLSAIDMEGWGALRGESPYDFYFMGDMLGAYFHEDLARAYNLVDARIKDPLEKEQYYSGISSITSGALDRAIWKDPEKFRVMTRNLTPSQNAFLYAFQGRRIAEWISSPAIFAQFPYRPEFYWAGMEPRYVPIAKDAFAEEMRRLNKKPAGNRL